EGGRRHPRREIELAAGPGQRTRIGRLHANELGRRGPRRVAPDSVALVPIQTADDMDDSLALVTHLRVDAMRDRDARPDEMVVLQRTHRDVLPDPDGRPPGCNWDQGEAFRSTLVPDTLEPARAVEPVEYRRPPVVRRAGCADRQHRRLLLRKVDAVVASVPDVPHADRLVRARVE